MGTQENWQLHSMIVYLLTAFGPGQLMLQIRRRQQDQLSKLSLNGFHKRLADELEKANLLSPKAEGSESETGFVAALVEQGQGLGLEYESDIAVYAALVLAAKSNTPDSTGYSWIDEILQQADTSGDEKMTIIEMRWNRLAEKDPALAPSPTLLGDLREAF